MLARARTALEASEGHPLLTGVRVAEDQQIGRDIGVHGHAPGRAMLRHRRIEPDLIGRRAVSGHEELEPHPGELLDARPGTIGQAEQQQSLGSRNARALHHLGQATPEARAKIADRAWRDRLDGSGDCGRGHSILLSCAAGLPGKCPTPSRKVLSSLT